MGWSESDEGYYTKDMQIEQREKETDKIVNSCFPFYIAFIIIIILLVIIWVYENFK